MKKFNVEKFWNGVKNFFYTSEDERPINWPGFTSGVYIALYVVLLINLIDILTELSKTPEVNTVLEVVILKITWICIFLGVFGTLHILKIRKDKNKNKISK